MGKRQAIGRVECSPLHSLLMVQGEAMESLRCALGCARTTAEFRFANRLPLRKKITNLFPKSKLFFMMRKDGEF